MLKYLVSIVLCATSLQAACPITHVYVSKIYFKHNQKFTADEEQSFIVGTLFPDIRYLGEAERHETHFDHVSLEEIDNELNPFIAGMKFHSYVDILRDELVQKEDVYERIKPYVSGHYHTFLKLVEDEILSKDRSYNNISIMLSTLHPEEIKSGISEKCLSKWHQALSFLFMTSPSQMLSLASMSGKGLMDISPEDIQAWNKVIKLAANDEALIKWVETLTLFFEKTLEASHPISLRE